MSQFKIDHFRDISFADPEENLAFDDALLKSAEAEEIGNTLRLWESPVYFAVLGRTCKADEDLDLKALERDRIPVLRRSSGGGTVLQGPGCVNFSFILSKEHPKELSDLRKSYHIILEGVLTLLKDLGIDAEFHPISDLALVEGQKKFSGNAQRRGRKFILHHGTLLYDFDLSLISKYLKIPRDIPQYRQGRSHQDFVTNLPLKGQDLRKGFQRFYRLLS